MRLPVDPKLPIPGTTDYERQLNNQLVRLLRDVNQQVNGITEGGMYSFHGAMTAAPTTGSWNQGDFVRNSAPTELGSGGSKYIIKEFVCVASGSPGTWVQSRSLTGN